MVLFIVEEVLRRCTRARLTRRTSTSTSNPACSIRAHLDRPLGDAGARLPLQCVLAPMRSRRERKVPERLEAGPATSKWSSGTASGSAEKAPRGRLQEAEQGAAQTVAVKKNQAGHQKAPAGTKATGSHANKKRGAAPPTGSSRAKKQRASTRRTSHSAANASTPSGKKDKTSTEAATSSSGEMDEDQEDDDGQQEPRRQRREDGAAEQPAETAEKKEAICTDTGHKVGVSDDARQTTQASSAVEPAAIEADRDTAKAEIPSGDADARSPKTSSASEELGFPKRQKAAATQPPSSLQPTTDGSVSPSAAAGVAQKSPIGLHHRRNSSEAQSMEQTSSPVQLGSIAIPPTQAPPRKRSALSLNIPTATASPASAAAVKSAAAAASAASIPQAQAPAPATGVTPQAGANPAASASAAAKVSNEQREAATAAVVDALLRHPIQKHPWSQIEHARFLDALHFYHRDWRRIARHVGHNRTVADVRTHSQVWNSRSTHYGTLLAQTQSQSLNLQPEGGPELLSRQLLLLGQATGFSSP